MLLLGYYCYFWHTTATLQTSKGRVSDCLVLAGSPDCLSPPQQLYTLTLSQAEEEKEGEEEEGGEKKGGQSEKVQRNERGAGGQMDKLAKLASL